MGPQLLPAFALFQFRPATSMLTWNLMLLPPHLAVADQDATRSSLSGTTHDLTTITSGDIPESCMPHPTTAVTVATVAMVATVATVAMAAMAKAMVAMVATVTAMAA